MEIKCGKCGGEVPGGILRELAGQGVCWECYKSAQEAGGLVEMGCVSPEAGGCEYRDPFFIEVDEMFGDTYDWGVQHPRRMKALAEARCYLGHKECRRQKEELEKMLGLARAAYQSKTGFCPHQGCGKALEIRSEESITHAVCPVHGEIWHEHID